MASNYFCEQAKWEHTSPMRTLQRSQPEAPGAVSVCHHSLRGQGQAWAGFTEKELCLSYQRQTRQAPPAVPQEKELFKVSC